LIITTFLRTLLCQKIHICGLKRWIHWWENLATRKTMFLYYKYMQKRIKEFLASNFPTNDNGRSLFQLQIGNRPKQKIWPAAIYNDTNWKANTTIGFANSNTSFVSRSNGQNVGRIWWKSTNWPNSITTSKMDNGIGKWWIFN